MERDYLMGTEFVWDDEKVWKWIVMIVAQHGECT